MLSVFRIYTLNRKISCLHSCILGGLEELLANSKNVLYTFTFTLSYISAKLPPPPPRHHPSLRIWSLLEVITFELYLDIANLLCSTCDIQVGTSLSIHRSKNLSEVLLISQALSEITFATARQLQVLISSQSASSSPVTLTKASNIQCLAVL